MVAVAKRFERRPIESRVGAFPDVFGSTNSRFKGTESRSEPRIRFRLATGEFGNYCYVGLFPIVVSCAKTNKDIFEIFSPSGSQAILVFSGIALIRRGRRMQGGYEKMTIFDQYLALSEKRL